MPRTYTLRGSFPFQENDQVTVLPPERKQLWNGSFSKNWIIDDIQIVITSHNHDEKMLSDDMVHLVIATRHNGALPSFSISTQVQGPTVRDNRQVWWGSMDSGNFQTVLDPENLVVEDLYVNGWYSDQQTGAIFALTQDIGYVITLREERTSLPRTILTLIKELAQDTPSEST